MRLRRLAPRATRVEASGGIVGRQQRRFGEIFVRCGNVVRSRAIQESYLNEENGMPNVKLVVIYPRPKDIESFEKGYQNEHEPMAAEKLTGKTEIVATKVLSSPQGSAPFHRIVEGY